MLPSELSPEQQRELADLLSGGDAISCLHLWQQCTRFLQKTQVSPAGYYQVWKACFEDWSVEDNGPPPMWAPNSEQMATANVTIWADQSGVEVNDFHQWTVNHRVQFWSQAVKHLGIEWESVGRPLDESVEVEHARWYPDARLNIVSSCFQAKPDDVAVVFQSPGQSIEQWTYQQLRDLTNQVSNSIVESGFQVGDAIAVFMPMTSLSIAIYLGIVQAGCAVVSIADSFAPPEIKTRLEAAQAKAVITYDCQLRMGKVLPLYAQVTQATTLPAIVIGFAQQDPAVTLRVQDRIWSDFLSDKTEFSPIVCDSDDTINVLFSSGTTGTPKAIPWSHLTPIKCAVDGFCHQNIQAGQVCVWPTNLGWMMGPWLIFASLLNRATIGLYQDAPMGSGFGQFVQEANVNMLGVVPTIVKAWRKTREMEAFDWSRISVFSSTGESSQRDDMFYLSALAQMKPVIEYCGGTEIGGGYITSVVTEPNVPAAFNTPSVGLDFVVLDEQNVPSLSGELFLIPPSIGLSNRLLNRDHFETYFGETPCADQHKTLRRHGDHFRVYPSSITGHSIWMAGGRVDDTMNLGGIKTSSAEMERVLNQLGAVRETAAVAFAQDGPAELVVFAVLDAEETRTTADLEDLRRSMNQLLKERLNPLFRVCRLVVVDALPRTASGKVMRRKLREQLV